MKNVVIKMSHIGVIQILEQAIGKYKVSSFDILDKLSINDLESMRDKLVIEYNKTIETRRFTAEMLYDRTHRKD